MKNRLSNLIAILIILDVPFTLGAIVAKATGATPWPWWSVALAAAPILLFLVGTLLLLVLIAICEIFTDPDDLDPFH